MDATRKSGLGKTAAEASANGCRRAAILGQPARGCRYLIGASFRTQILDYKQRADQYMARPGTCECAAAAEAAEQGGGRGVGLVGVPCHGGS